jgi:cold shock CspA family protein
MEARIARISERGFAFLTLDDGSGDIFLHASALPYGEFARLAIDDRIVCEIEIDHARGVGKRRAIHARRVAEQAPNFDDGDEID